MMQFLQDQQGQDVVEYSLLIALIAVVCAGLIGNAGTGYVNLWTTVDNVLANAANTTAS